MNLSVLTSHLLANRFEAYVQQLLDYAEKRHFSWPQTLREKGREQWTDALRRSERTLLEMLSQQAGDQYIQQALKHWRSTPPASAGQPAVPAEEMADMNYTRQQVFRQEALLLTQKLEEVTALYRQIDEFFFQFTTAATKTHLALLTARLGAGEQLLLEAQQLSHLGSFTWNFIQGGSEQSPNLYRIFEWDEPHTWETFLRCVHADDREKLIGALLHSETDSAFTCEYRYLAASGVKVLCTRARVEWENGLPASMRGTVQDISEQKAIEAKLVSQTLQLQNSVALLENFASVVSHDLKSPLQKIRLSADFVLSVANDGLTAKQLQYLNNIQKSAGKMADLIDRLLAYATVDKNEARQYCSLQDILDDAVDALGHLIEDKDAKILSDGLPRATVIPFQMAQLFQNLLSNSLKFSKENLKPVILITHSVFEEFPNQKTDKPHARTLTIEIADNGLGFAQKDAEKIFAPLKRLHQGDTIQGHGLGLSICKKIVENHGGHLSASSDVGKGATFKIVLPLIVPEGS